MDSNLEQERYIVTDEKAFSRWVRGALTKVAGPERGVKACIRLFPGYAYVPIEGNPNEGDDTQSNPNLNIPALAVTWYALPPGLEVTITCHDEQARAHFDALLSEIDRRWPGGKARDKGPSEKVQLRAALYRSIKAEHPKVSYAAVALLANDNKDNLEVHTSDSVRNAYQAMGWKWERADRIR